MKHGHSEYDNNTDTVTKLKKSDKFKIIISIIIMLVSDTDTNTLFQSCRCYITRNESECQYQPLFHFLKRANQEVKSEGYNIIENLIGKIIQFIYSNQIVQISCVAQPYIPIYGIILYVFI